MLAKGCADAGLCDARGSASARGPAGVLPPPDGTNQFKGPVLRAGEPE
eukprot:CAMPEP_0179198092 /NCGR_PEP_ID=MMETSP0796-20121207/98521_1 /TAXON_ID=73915 /ORGANISM="Pyrodinium bahamense, Strain pbaha01" /LENGTH=47 /DNA_ID= /DNA_START= /DNA_END= /DNA_ORIENTATION=